MTCRLRFIVLVILAVTSAACSGAPSSSATTTGPSPSPTSVGQIADDAALFRQVTATEPFGGYTLFPNAAAVTAGTLTGSEAHRPMVRVSLNARAAGALVNGRLPAGARFPDGAIVFKEVLAVAGGAPSVYIVMYKATSDARAGNGWLWAEYGPGGNVVYPLTNRGSACTACHQLGQGPANDSVRTFERQQ